MAIAQPNTESQPFGLATVCIKGLTDDDGLDGLGDLISGHAAQRHEKRRDIEVVGEHRFGELLKMYEELLKMYEELLKMYEEFLGLDLELVLHRGPYVRQDDLLHIKTVLTPEEINIFLQLSLGYEGYKNYFLTGEFVSKLVQVSYLAGNNDFKLYCPSERIAYLGCWLSGTSERLVRVKLDGDLGYNIGAISSYASFTINEYRNLAAFCILNESERCVLRTPNKELLNGFINLVPHKYHKIYFIHPDGTEELIKRTRHK